MPGLSQPVCLTNPVHIGRVECRTALGDARETVDRLLQGESALALTPVYGGDGGERVPLALLEPMDMRHFITPLAGSGWGTARRPVFLTGSNFGIDGLYGIGKHRDKAYAGWSTPQDCAEYIRRELGWGPNISIFSHACVSAQLGIFQAASWIGKGLADSCLAFAVLESEGDGPVISAQALYNEMYHFTSNEPGGIGFKRALKAIATGMDSDCYWIKGHGTGTIEAGKLEAENAHELFPGHPLISWKGAIGHTLGSCALVELAIALQAHRDGMIPGTVGSSRPCFSPDVATDPFSSNPYDSILLLCNAFGGAHGAMFVRNV